MTSLIDNILGKIHCGDAAEVMATWPDEFVDLTVTSPPYADLRDYADGHEFDLEAVARELYRITKPGGVVVWVVGDVHRNHRLKLLPFLHCLAFEAAGFGVLDVMIYKKAGTYILHNHRQYPSCYEFMLVFSKGRPATFNPLRDRRNTTAGATIMGGKRNPDGSFKPAPNPGEKIGLIGYRTNVWRYTAGFNLGATDKIAFEHPAIFPEALARDHILSWSNPGDVVLDPFCGSGTTLKMAIETGRRWVGIDISLQYCELSRRRVAAANMPLPGIMQ